MGKPVPLPRPLDDGPGSGPLTRNEVEFLRRGGFVPKPRGSEADGGDSFRKTQEKYDSLVRASLTLEQAAQRLRMAPSQVVQRLTAQPPTLYGIRTGATWLLPDLQFEESGLIPGFEEIAARLDPDLHPLAVFNWFTLPNPDLPEDEREERNLSPREWLQSGRSPALVAALAADL